MLKRLDRWLSGQLEHGGYWGRSLALGFGMASVGFYMLYLAATDRDELRRAGWRVVLIALLMPLACWAAPVFVWIKLRERAGKPGLPPMLIPCVWMTVNALAALFWLAIIWAGLMLDKPVGLKELALQAVSIAGLALAALDVDKVLARKERDTQQNGKTPRTGIHHMT